MKRRAWSWAVAVIAVGLVVGTWAHAQQPQPDPRDEFRRELQAMEKRLSGQINDLGANIKVLTDLVQKRLAK